MNIEELSEQVIEEVDSMVFSSDYLVEPKNREKFQAYLDRWSRELKSMSETFPTGSVEKEDDEW